MTIRLYDARPIELIESRQQSIQCVVVIVAVLHFTLSRITAYHIHTTLHYTFAALCISLEFNRGDSFNASHNCKFVLICCT